MGDVVKLRIKESVQDLYNPRPEMITVEKQAYEHDIWMKKSHEKYIDIVNSQLEELRSMSLWDRIFNWH